MKLYLSLDYDRCANLLFSDNHPGIANEILGFIDFLQAKGDEELRALFEEKDKLNDLIMLAIQNVAAKLEKEILDIKLGHDVTILVGSNRQDHRIDFINSKNHKTISCFDAYENFAKKNNMNFCKFLLGDIYHPDKTLRDTSLEAGTTMSKLKPVTDHLKNKTIKEIREYLNSFSQSPFFEDKLLLISSQLKFVSHLQSEESDPGTYIFMDDRNEILDGLKDFLKTNKELPNNINIKINHFDSFKSILSHIRSYIKDTASHSALITEVYSKETTKKRSRNGLPKEGAHIVPGLLQGQSIFEANKKSRIKPDIETATASSSAPAI